METLATNSSWDLTVTDFFKRNVHKFHQNNLSMNQN